MNTIEDNQNYDVGVIVGRFQIPSLHCEHQRLIDYVRARHRKVLIVLGVAPVVNTINNPLDFEARARMIHEVYPDITITYIKDINNDTAWSKNLDALVRDFLSPTQTAILYGSRDSFINVYDGKFNTFELLQKNYVSGTEVRNQVRQEVVPTEDFRKGVIWASANRFPVVYTTVDIAIFKNTEYKEILLARKPHSKQWQLVGGFADPASPSFETDACREIAEETGLSVGGISYLGSYLIDDPRYRNEPDVIKTILFRATCFGAARAADDVEEVKWFESDYVRKNMERLVAPLHLKLVERALA